MKKVCSALLMLVLFAGVFTIPVNASTISNPPAIEQSIESELDVYYPLLDWTATQSITHGVVLRNGVGNVVCSYRAYNTTHKVVASITLQKNVSGRWVDMQTWSGSNTFSCFIAANVALPKGTYRTRTTGSVYTSAWAHLETVTVYSTPNSH